MRDPLIGLVGKPSSGKSTTLNALTDADAKMGAFPFTTIDPNTATGYVSVDCACGRKGIEKQQFCKPNYGWCNNGTRYVPVVLLDVAGLVPGAHEGKGLGNKFLDDLRHADCLIHVVDASGTTDAEGKNAKGYDPLQDVDWLQDEIYRWVKGNLMEKWGSIVRRHIATKSSAAETLANQFSGYGATRALVQTALLQAQKNDLAGEKLEKWSQDEIDNVVKTFVTTKFPTVLALNKSDHPDADRNIAKIARKYPDTPHVLCSAISEVLLKKLVKQNYIKYEPGTEFVDTREDGFDDLKPLEPNLLERVETVRDLVLYRFGSTGVQDALKAAIDALKLVPVFTVRNINNFGGKTVFPDCILVPEGTTVRQVSDKVMGDSKIMWIEGVNGKLADDETISKGRNDILSFRRGD
ncbi:hypothetical protein DASB73_041390 [Starmerella bacillaris]|uniref:OBG-type G domain-containing protein n=1 Tax=Starmerella bacillaris TaxID=1247836 RepID=A0AAV5RNU2_STABA|nr:hypothetical protein DASB73_041390 [Starmerella bacillaris]